jgi:hypothetical protein
MNNFFKIIWAFGLWCCAVGAAWGQVCGERITLPTDTDSTGQNNNLISLLDRFGNTFSWHDMSVPNSVDMQNRTGSNSLSCVAGHFTLHFVDVVRNNQEWLVRFLAIYLNLLTQTYLREGVILWYIRI